MLRTSRFLMLAFFLVVNAVTAAPPILVVPTAEAPIHLAVTMPEDAKPATAGAYQLVEVDVPGVVLPAQLVAAVASDGQSAKPIRRLVATIPPRADAGASRHFTLQSADAAGQAESFRFEDTTADKSRGLFDGERPVLVYNYGVITGEKVPETDHRGTRACYVHPLYGLEGESLTEDFPRDHYHHHGVFWTWPHVRVDGKDHDLWAGASIHQRFVRWLDHGQGGPVAGVLGVENGWFVGDKKVMIERVWLLAGKTIGDSRAVDVSITLIPTDQPVSLLGAAGKSYGGLTVRFAPPGPKDPATRITTVEGVTPVDLSESRQAWADFTSKLNGHPTASGATVMIAPDHPAYPPTWLLRHYGPLCVGWPGVTSQTLAPGVPVRMDYRLWIHKTVVDAEEIQRAYEAYKAGLQATWQ